MARGVVAVSAVRLTLSDTNAEAAETWVDAMGIFRPLKERGTGVWALQEHNAKG